MRLLYDMQGAQADALNTVMAELWQPTMKVPEVHHCAQEDVLEQLVEKYLASIPAQDAPAKRSTSQLTPIEFSFPQHVVREDVRQVPPACPLHTENQVLAADPYRWNPYTTQLA